MKKLEMHCHSNRSDGVNTPNEVIAEAQRLDLDFLALTDHDVISPQSLQKQLQSSGIQSCDSVEISARNYELWKSLHLVSYAKKFQESLHSTLEVSRAWKLDMKLGQIKKLVDQQGFIASDAWFEEFLIKKWRTLWGSNKWDLARYLARNPDNRVKMKSMLGELLVDNDLVGDFYQECFKREGSLYEQYGYEVPEYEPSVQTSVDEVVNKAGGLISLAHPYVTFDERKGWLREFERTVEDYVTKWVRWIELNSMTPLEWIRPILEVRAKYDLILTFWSDCHAIGYDWEDGKHSTIGHLCHNLLGLWESFSYNYNDWKSFTQVYFDRFQKAIWI